MYKQLSSRYMTFILVLFLLITNGQSTISSVEKTVSYRFLIADQNQPILSINFGDDKYKLLKGDEYYHLDLNQRSWDEIVNANYEVFSITVGDANYDFDFSLLQDESRVVEILIPNYFELSNLENNANSFYILTNSNGGWGDHNADLRLKYHDGTPSTLLERTDIKYKIDNNWYIIYKTDELKNKNFDLERLNHEKHDEVYNLFNKIPQEHLTTSVLLNKGWGWEPHVAADINTANEIKKRFNQTEGVSFSVDASLASLAYPDLGISKLRNLILELKNGWRVDLIPKVTLSQDIKNNDIYTIPDNFKLLDSDTFFINDLRMNNARTEDYTIDDFKALSKPVLHLSASNPYSKIDEYMYKDSKWSEQDRPYEAPNTKKIPVKEITVMDDVRYVKSSFYDYLSDFELNGNHRSKKQNSKSDQDKYVQFRNFNTALSDYYSTEKVEHPIYTGHFQHDDYKGAVYSSIADSLDLYGYGKYKTYDYNKFFATNNSMFNIHGNVNAYNDARAIVPNLVTKNLSNNELMIATKDDKTSVRSPFFNKEFLLGENSKNTVLADVYETVAFPFILEPREGVPYWTFDSLKHKAQMTEDNVNNMHFIDHTVTKGVKNKGSSGEDKAEYGFFPLNDPDAPESNQDVYNYNYGTGMRMDIPFSMTSDGRVGGQDIVFEFSGDDDVWIFIDGKLALDLGGAHGRVQGTFNFRTGKYSVKDSFYKESGTGLKPENDFELDKGISQHQLTIFYMERGQWESNLKMSFNFPESNNLTVKKEVNVEGVHEEFKKFFLNDEFNLNIKSHATHYQEQSEKPSNNGFKIPQEEIRDYGSVEANDLTVPIGAEYSSMYDNKTNMDLLVGDDPIKIKNEEVITFENQFRLGSYLKITEDYETTRYQKPLWKVYENGILINSDLDLGSSPSDGRTEPSGFGYPIDNKYKIDYYDPDPDVQKTIRFGTYIREEDRNSNLIMDVLVVNRPLVQSLQISKSFLGEVKDEVEFHIVVKYAEEEIEFTMTLNEANGFQETIDGLPVGAEYYVSEVVPEGYYVHSVTQNGVKINAEDVSGVIGDTMESIQYVNAPYIDIEVVKQWEGSVDTQLPGSINIGLFANDLQEPIETVTLNNPDWNYQFEKLPMYSETGTIIVYLIYELDAKGNKVENGTVIEIDKRKYEVTYQTEDGIVKINNRYISGNDFEFRKVRKGTDGIVNLSGAEFRLYRYQYDPDISCDSYCNGYYHNTDKPFIVEDLSTTDLDGNVFKLSSLYTDEIYFLEETVVPTGMQKPKGVWMIRVNGDGGVDIVAEFKDDMPAFEFDGSELLLYNKPQWILSPTGGSGTRYMMVGLLFMASSGMLYLKKQKEK